MKLYELLAVGTIFLAPFLGGCPPRQEKEFPVLPELPTYETVASGEYRNIDIRVVDSSSGSRRRAVRAPELPQ